MTSTIRITTLAVVVAFLSSPLAVCFGQPTLAITPTLQRELGELQTKCLLGIPAGPEWQRELLARSDRQLRAHVRSMTFRSPDFLSALNDCLAKPYDDQVPSVEELLESVPHQTTTSADQWQLSHELCLRLRLLTWDARLWQPSACAARLSDLSVAVTEHNTSRTEGSWKALAESIESLQDDPVSSELGSRIAREIRTANVLVQLPLRPFAHTTTPSIQRAIHEQQSSGNFRIVANGSAKIGLDVTFMDAPAGVRCQIDLRGTGNSQITARSDRVQLLADMHTDLAGYIGLPLMNFSEPSICIDVHNRLCLRDADYTGRVLALNRALQGTVRRASLKKLPSMERESELKLEKRLTESISASLKQSVSSSSSAFGIDTNQKLKEYGVDGQIVSTRVGQAASFKLAVEGKFGEPRISPWTDVDGPLENEIVLGVGQGLLTQILDIWRGKQMRETELRETLFQSLGQAPIFNQEILSVTPCTFHMAYRRPFQIELDDNLLTLTMSCRAFDTGKSLRVQQDFAIRVQYACAYANGQMSLHRMAPAQLDNLGAKDREMIEPNLDRIFPPHTEAVAGSFVNQLLSVGNLTLDRYEFKGGWMFARIRYDPQRLAEKVTQQLQQLGQ